MNVRGNNLWVGVRGSWAAHTGYCNHNTRVVVTLPPRPPLACPCLPTPRCVWQSWYKLPWTTVFPSWREIKWELKAYTRFSVLNFALLIFSFSFFLHFCHVSVMVGFLHVVLWCGFSFSLVFLSIPLSLTLSAGSVCVSVDVSLPFHSDPRRIFKKNILARPHTRGGKLVRSISHRYKLSMIHSNPPAEAPSVVESFPRKYHNTQHDPPSLDSHFRRVFRPVSRHR